MQETAGVSWESPLWTLAHQGAPLIPRGLSADAVEHAGPLLLKLEEAGPPLLKAAAPSHWLVVGAGQPAPAMPRRTGRVPLPGLSWATSRWWEWGAAPRAGEGAQGRPGEGQRGREGLSQAPLEDDAPW